MTYLLAFRLPSFACVASQKNWWTSVAQGIRLFVREQGIKIVAAEKEIKFRAIKDGMHSTC